jgi:hypothetical protein
VNNQILSTGRLSRPAQKQFPLLWLAAFFFLFSVSHAAPIVPFGAIWKFLDNGSNQSNAWRTLNYEDDGWASGPAQLGYGDGDEATEVGYGTNAANKYITTYFRNTFNVPDRSAFTNLILRLIRDDGVVVYLNGIEVFRNNMPGGAINYLTEAPLSIGGSGETTILTTNVNPALLFNGANVLAVEIHQDSVGSSDISFDLELNDGRDDSPRVAIISPANNSAIAAPGNVTITVNASDTNGMVTNVQLFAGNVLLGQKTNAPYIFVWSNVIAGAHIISATVRDNDGLLTASTPVKFTVGNGAGSASVLIPQGAVWKYLDTGTNLGAAWRGTNFDDSAWTNGPAQLGYGDNDEATVVKFGTNSASKFITTYFRRTFVVSNLPSVSALVLRLLEDDGAVVYLNSNEVFRSNMPTGTIDYLTLASTSLGAPQENEFIRTNLNLSSLRAGTNTIAVEIHQASGSSGDLSFDLELLGAELPKVLRGPWLQSVSWSNAIVKWRTDASVNGRVQFGTNQGNLNFEVVGTNTMEHRLSLTNLAPGRKYFYSIGTTNGTLLNGPDYYFITPPLPGTDKKMRFWALGDAGTADVNQFNVRDAFYRANTNDLDAILLLGDNAYNAGTDSEYQRAVFDTYPTMLRKTPLWSTIGNHETDQLTAPLPTIPYYQIFSLPQRGEVGGVASGTEDYYSFDYGNVHFVCLDSMTSSRAINGTMANWLRNDLADTTQDWLIAFWHHPPYTKGSHDSDVESELVQMRQNILPILESYGVDLVLCGHSHAYERSHLLNGHYGASFTLAPEMRINAGGGRPQENGAYVKPLGLQGNQGAVYTVTGSAGKVGGGSLDHEAMFLSLNRLGSLYFEVSTNRLDAFFIRDNGTTNDNFSIIKGNSITVADASLVERDSGTSNMTFTLTMAQTSAVPVTVSYVTASETALSGVDFTGRTNSVTFNAGVRTQSVTVPIVGDLLLELDETFALSFSGTPMLTRMLARGTIIDNDLTNAEPKLISVGRTNNTFTLRWPIMTGRTYRVEYKNSLSETQWQLLPQVINGNNTIYTFMDNTITNVPQRFYRVSVQ